ncbi:hypothetical protein MKJ04_16090 [Pontibacter sp. E15-1]|uniref:DUF7033 domain-containing protein n=1 Tax=Pontibacter sp. E15-1 TaxID=2919918 RepID=UPI001F4FE1B9|nr:hypothetical protein [Pontibacter sp. E15-1]MCJ8166367.1 hypothetical protein [Pontibacter sp. E15-1]
MDILPYILRHLYLLYPKARTLPLAYGPAHGASVSVRQYEGQFFEGKRARPESLVWKVYHGVRLPFFFEENEQEELVTYFPDGSAKINYDILASAFYLLSGWQEHHSKARDKFGRYPYPASVQAAHGFITVPVVNYYFEILRETLERVYHVGLQADPWDNNSFATCLTCDVDRLQSAWKVAGLQRLKQGALSDFSSLLLQKIRGRDAWQNLREVTATADRFKARITFFFLTSLQRYQGHPNADYDVTRRACQDSILGLMASGHEVGIHGSFGTAVHGPQLRAEMAQLPTKVSGNRFHYLCHDPQHTPQVLQQSGLRYDTTLGFAEHFGFRNSFCHPFFPFNFETGEAFGYLELPLLLMDTSLYHPGYLNVKPSEALRLLQTMLEEVIKFRGLFTLLWHNENFSSYSEYPTPAGEPNWSEVLHHLLRQLQQANTAFLTCAEATARITEKATKL